MLRFTKFPGGIPSNSPALKIGAGEVLNSTIEGGYGNRVFDDFRGFREIFGPKALDFALRPQGSPGTKIFPDPEKKLRFELAKFWRLK